MERRNFIKGFLVGGAAMAADTALIKLASAAEVQQLMAQRDVVVGPDLTPQYPGYDVFNGYIYIQSQPGKYVPIGVVREINVSAPIDNMLSWEGTARLMPGLTEATMKFGGPF